MTAASTGPSPEVDRAGGDLDEPWVDEVPTGVVEAFVAAVCRPSDRAGVHESLGRARPRDLAGMVAAVDDHQPMTLEVVVDVLAEVGASPSSIARAVGVDRDDVEVLLGSPLDDAPRPSTRGGADQVIDVGGARSAVPEVDPGPRENGSTSPSPGGTGSPDDTAPTTAEAASAHPGHADPDRPAPDRRPSRVVVVDSSTSPRSDPVGSARPTSPGADDGAPDRDVQGAGVGAPDDVVGNHDVVEDDGDIEDPGDVRDHTGVRDHAGVPVAGRGEDRSRAGPASTSSVTVRRLAWSAVLFVVLVGAVLALVALLGGWP